MSDKGFSDYIKRLEKFSKKITASPKKSVKFLRDAGIYNAEGNLQSAYKNLCIPQKQG